MIEPLSDTARVVLAFIRDHPGHGFDHISRMLGIDDALVRNEIAQLLNRKLIIKQMKQVGTVMEPREPSWKSPVTYYPA